MWPVFSSLQDVSTLHKTVSLLSKKYSRTFRLIEALRVLAKFSLVLLKGGLNRNSLKGFSPNFTWQQPISTKNYDDQTIFYSHAVIFLCRQSNGTWIWGWLSLWSKSFHVLWQILESIQNASISIIMTGAIPFLPFSNLRKKENFLQNLAAIIRKPSLNTLSILALSIGEATSLQKHGKHMTACG